MLWVCVGVWRVYQGVSRWKSGVTATVYCRVVCFLCGLIKIGFITVALIWSLAACVQ